MLLASLVRKHVYSCISENNFGPSNQIIDPTGYIMQNTRHWKAKVTHARTYTNQYVDFIMEECCGIKVYKQTQNCWQIIKNERKHSY